jgi:hypothetical protein
VPVKSFTRYSVSVPMSTIKGDDADDPDIDDDEGEDAVTDVDEDEAA